jgi:hypothetical protein
MHGRIGLWVSFSAGAIRYELRRRAREHSGYGLYHKQQQILQPLSKRMCSGFKLPWQIDGKHTGISRRCRKKAIVHRIVALVGAGRATLLLGLEIACGLMLPFGGNGSGFVPISLARVFAFEATGDRTGGEDITRATPPALLSFVEFTGAGLLRVAAFALLAVPSVQVQGHALCTAELPGIAR